MIIRSYFDKFSTNGCCSSIWAMLGLSIELDCLFEQHHRNVIFNRIQQFTRMADQTVLCVGQFDASLALKADQDVEEFFAEGHTYLLRCRLCACLALPQAEDEIIFQQRAGVEQPSAQATVLLPLDRVLLS
jgi:hypothetical protein